MSNCHPQPLALTGSQYSSLFDSGLRAMSGHARALSLPVATHTFSSRSSVKSTFWSHGSHESDDELEPHSPLSGLSCHSAMTVTCSTASDHVLMVKGVPLIFGMSHNVSSDVSSTCSRRYSCLDSLTPSSRWSTDSEASSNEGSPPTSPIDLMDDSFLSLTASTQPSTRRCSVSSQGYAPLTKSRSPSRRESLFSLIERTHHDINDEHWMSEFEADPPLDVPLVTAAEMSPVDVSRWENDWRAFHAHWIQDPHLPE